MLSGNNVFRMHTSDLAQFAIVNSPSNPQTACFSFRNRMTCLAYNFNNPVSFMALQATCFLEINTKKRPFIKAILRLWMHDLFIFFICLSPVWLNKTLLNFYDSHIHILRNNVACWKSLEGNHKHHSNLKEMSRLLSLSQPLVWSIKMIFYIRLKGFFPAANRPTPNRKFDSSEAEHRKPIIKKLHSDFAKWKF